MNKIVLVVALLVIIGGGYVLMQKSAQLEVDQAKTEAPSGVAEQTKEVDKEMMKDGDKMMGVGIVYKSGIIHKEDDTAMTPIATDFAFASGVKVSPKGLVTLKDGSTKQLLNGESVWEDGLIMKAGEHMMMDGDMMDDAKEMMKDGAMTDKKMDAGEQIMVKAGSYEVFAQEKIARAGTGDVVLFFKAGWCPSCRGVDTDIKAHLKDIPAGLSILEVDYDNSPELKKKYGVTYQHTFVQVDAVGNLVKKWSSSPTLAAIVAEIK